VELDYVLNLVQKDWTKVAGSKARTQPPFEEDVEFVAAPEPHCRVFRSVRPTSTLRPLAIVELCNRGIELTP